MSSFPIWPSEAVLLGVFLEQYIQAKSDNEDTSVLDFIEEHLRGITPEMVEYSRVPFSFDDKRMPIDIFMWLGDDDKEPSGPCGVGEVALSVIRGYEGRLFGKTAEGIVEYVITDNSRKSLVDLIRDLVMPYAARSWCDERLTLPAELRHVRTVALAQCCYLDGIVETARCHLLPQIQDNQELQQTQTIVEFIEGWAKKLRERTRRRGQDEVEQIEREMVKLIQNSGSVSLFSIGRLIGRILADSQRCNNAWVDAVVARGGDLDIDDEVSVAAGVLSWQYLAPEEFIDEYVSILRELSTKKEIKSLGYAPLMIRRELSRCEVRRKWFREETIWADYELIATSANWMGQTRTLMGMILGELVFSLHEPDTVAQERDRASSTPREFLMLRDAAKDPALGPVAVVANDFHQLANRGLSPEAMLRMVVNSLEPLVRSVWPEEFSNKNVRVSFSEVVDRKAHRTKGLEQEFARRAQYLYKRFRNPVVHPSGENVFTYLDVMHVLFGLQRLHELGESIKKGRDMKGG